MRVCLKNDFTHECDNNPFLLGWPLILLFDPLHMKMVLITGGGGGVKTFFKHACQATLWN